MKYLIIGLGNYGGVLAEELTALGHEVVGVDSEEFQAERYKDKVATTYVLDVTDEMALSVLPLNSVDIVIVAIGENFGASVRIVSLLKKHNVKHIYARAVDEVHKAVLDAFSLDRILTPEKMLQGFWYSLWSLMPKLSISPLMKTITYLNSQYLPNS